MKKNKILKLFLIFICLIAISFVGNNVYGYQLKFKALPQGEGDGSARIITFGVTSSESEGTKTNANYSDDKIKFSDYNYATYKILFHETYHSIYSTKNKGDYYVGYDKNKENVILDNNIIFAKEWSISDVRNYLTTDGVWVSRKDKDTSEKTLEYKRGEKDFYLKKQKILTSSIVPVTDITLPKEEQKHATVTLSTWYLSKDAINQVIKKFNINSENNSVFFSLPANTGPDNFGNVQDWNTAFGALVQISNRSSHWDALNYEKKIWNLETSEGDIIYRDATRLFCFKFI